MKNTAINLLKYVLFFPFLYSIILKISDFGYFRLLIDQSPIIPYYLKDFGIIFLIMDFIAILLILLDKSIRALIYSLVLYVIYTIFLVQLNIYSIDRHTIPCGCQGLFVFLSIKEHLVLNAMLIILNLALILFYFDKSSYKSILSKIGFKKVRNI